MSFNDDQIERYARHLVLKEIGGPGQQALSAAKVLLVGVGGLGCPSAMYLTAAGVGNLGLLDDDSVALSNLQRQILFATTDIGKSKARQARHHLQQQNPDPNIIAHNFRLTDSNAHELFASYDIIIDGCDNFATRFLVNKACHELGKVLISAAVGRFDGQVSVHNSGNNSHPKTACYQCLVPSIPPEAETCEQVGVVGALTGIIGSTMALECIKLITGAGTPLLGKLLIWDGLKAAARTIDLPVDPACIVCGSEHGQNNPV